MVSTVVEKEEEDRVIPYMNIRFHNKTFLITSFLLSKVFSSKEEKGDFRSYTSLSCAKKSVVLGQRSTHPLSPERERV